MPKAPPIGQRIAALKQAPVEALRAALADHWLLIAAAAQRVGDDCLYVLADDLVAAFARMAEYKLDPNCTARVALVIALDALDRWHDEVFVVGLTARVIVEDDDRAARIRVACGLAHVHHGRDDALDVLARLLHDEFTIARAGAARAIGASGRRDASALLRYKLLVGDAAPEVIEEVVAALMALQRERAIPFCIELLGTKDVVRAEIIALALGSNRATEALDALATWSSQLRPTDRERLGFLPIALLRDDAANAWLVERIGSKFAPDALAAARALATFKSDPAIAKLLDEAISAQAVPALRTQLRALVS